MSSPGASRPTCRPPADETLPPVSIVRVSDADPALAARLLPLLSDAERARATGIRADGARVGFVVARAVLRHELSRVLGVAPVEVALQATSTGRPVLAGGDGPELSVTHTEGLLLVAWHPSLAVGVDVERGDRAVDPALVDRIATPAERSALAGLPPSSRSEGLLRLWVRKEAVAKADGRGLALGFGDLEVLGHGPLLVSPPARASAPALSASASSVSSSSSVSESESVSESVSRALRVGLGDGSGAWVRDLDVGGGHYAAVATIGGLAEVAVRAWGGPDG